MFVHALLQQVAALHPMPQPPQLLSSLVVSTHWLAQTFPLQGAHLPIAHVALAPHARPHWPQFAGSFDVSVHTPLQEGAQASEASKAAGASTVEPSAAEPSTALDASAASASVELVVESLEEHATKAITASATTKRRRWSGMFEGYPFTACKPSRADRRSDAR